MNTRNSLLHAINQGLTDHQRVALAVVTQTDGSVYRRAGARSVVWEDGTITGMISGGCVEQDLREHAAMAWEAGEIREISYDFRSPGDLLWGMGAGCNGALTVALLPLDEAANAALTQSIVADMRRRVTTPVPYLAATVLYTDDGTEVALGMVPDDTLREWMRHGLIPSMQSGDAPRSLRLAVQGTTCQILLEYVAPRPRLVVFGAGDDAIPLARQATHLDWNVSVVDHREAALHRLRFPDIDHCTVIHRDDYATVSVNPSSYVVLMTHNYARDMDIVRSLLPVSLPYLGILGPRRRFETMLSDLKQQGFAIRDMDLQKVHSPIGLDIGADTPEEIALAVMAELTARTRGRGGQPLTARVGPVQGVTQHE